tara:strand:- start:60 stop:305 length:246 start_codon:yes stop_codon:yes gene_type:complete
MKSKNILFIVLAIIVVGAVFSIFYFSNSEEQPNQFVDTIPDNSQDEPFESQGEGLPRQVSVSTQEELFQEIRSAVDEHLNE